MIQTGHSKEGTVRADRGLLRKGIHCVLKMTEGAKENMTEKSDECVRMGGGVLVTLWPEWAGTLNPPIPCFR